MQLNRNVTMRVTCDKHEVLTAIKKNRDEHAEIVAEARKGYLNKLETIFKDKLAKVEESRSKKGRVGSVRLDISEPDDHTDEYDTIIKMLELHQGSAIDLNVDEIRQFIENKWEWTDRWIAQTAAYSEKASKLLG